MSDLEQLAATPDPATTPWVPMWDLNGGIDLRYWGDYAPGSYTDGDVVVYQGVAYVCVRPTTKAPAPWVTSSIAGPPSYATALPGNPVDGQEAILVDSVTAPTYAFRFRYNAQSTSPYKWEYVGGTPWYAYAYQGTWQQFSGNSAWVGASPGLVAPRAGDYWISYSAQFTSTATGTLVQIAGGTAALMGMAQALSVNGGVNVHATFDQRINGFPQGVTLQPQVWANQATTSLANLACRINPARVS